MKKGHIISVVAVLLIAIGVYYFQNFEAETPPLWQKNYDFKIYSDPIVVGDKSYFVGGDKGVNKHFIFETDSNGDITAQTPELPATPFQPELIGKHLIVADAGRMTRAFAVPGLSIIWEQGSEQFFKIKPVKLDENRVLVTGNHKTLFCINASTGDPEWDCALETPIVSCGADKYIICLHQDPASSEEDSYCATAINPETGAIAWRITELENTPPLFAENICVLSSKGNHTIILEQRSGNIMLKNPDNRFKPIKILETYLLTLSKDKTNLMISSLESGNSWDINLQTPFQEAIKIKDTIFIADKKTLFASNIANGHKKWRMNLQDIYTLSHLRGGLFVTYKEYFTSRTTYGKFINPESSEVLWTAFGEQLFMRPSPMKNGDYLASYNGKVRLMPLVGPKTISSVNSDSVTVNDPFEKLDLNRRKNSQNEPLYSSEEDVISNDWK